MTTTDTTRDFGLGAVLSITDGALLCNIGEVYEILNWMTGDNLMTHQLPRAARECQQPLLDQHPQLADVVVPKLSGEDEYWAWLAEQAEVYGETLPVEPLAAADHTAIDPLTELTMMRPDMQIIPVVVDPEGDAS